MNRVAIFSDIHANYPALRAAYRDAYDLGCRDFWCLGDVVGRGTRPADVISCLAEIIPAHQRASRWILGNHDMMLLGRMPAAEVTEIDGLDKKTSMTATSEFVLNAISRHSAELKQHENKHLYDILDRELGTHASPLPHIYLAHGYYALDRFGKPDKEMAFREYTWFSTQVSDQFAAMLSSRRIKENPHVLIVGHTHMPSVWRKRTVDNSFEHLMGLDKTQTDLHYFYNIDPFNVPLYYTNLDEQPVFINPGSVGDPRLPFGSASYVILTFHSSTDVEIYFRRIEV